MGSGHGQSGIQHQGWPCRIPGKNDAEGNDGHRIESEENGDESILHGSFPDWSRCGSQIKGGFHFSPIREGA